MKIVSWWSGGVTSAVAGKLALDIYPNVKFIMMDTKNEHPDTYRFKEDCEKWYNRPIKVITALGDKFKTIQDVWHHYNSLNVSHGAICSATLKRDLRVKWEKENDYDYQVFGFDIDEPRRAKALKINYPKSKPLFPLLMHGLSKKDCLNILLENDINPPIVYELGFKNNNCFLTGCVQGGIGYWQKMQKEFPDKFDTMAKMEHDLTDKKGIPVTMLKDQSDYAKKTSKFQVFLKPHKDYPYLKDISMMKGRQPENLLECNGFCGTNDLEERKPSEGEIYLQPTLFNS